MQFPINLELEGRPCLVVGAGRIALRKTEQLVACGADVTVVAPAVNDGFRSLPVHVEERPYDSTDIVGRRLVITATGNREVDQQVFDDAEAHGIWVNSADDPDRCTATLPATVRRGDLLVTISTAGSSPALSSWLRQRLERVIGDEFATITDQLADRRRAIHATGGSTEAIDWRPIIEDVLAQHGIDNLFGVTTRNEVSA